MSEAKHTPGPWKIVRYTDVKNGDSDDLLRIVDSQGKDICGFGNTADYYNTAGDEPTDADAELMAASPDLLASLLECLAIVRLQNGNMHADTNAIQDRANAAIEKATGAK